MASKSKAKGNRFEREIVNLAKENGLEAERAYASNGKALGLPEDVDVKIAGKAFQCKVRKTIGDLYKPSKSNYGQIFKEDRGELLVMIRFEDLLTLLKERK